MSKLQELIGKYVADLESLGQKVDNDLLAAVTKACGPAIYRADSALVAATDKGEVERMKQNFCIKKLGCTEGADLDAAIQEVFKLYNKKQKQRPVVYYLLVQKLKKASLFKK